MNTLEVVAQKLSSIFISVFYGFLSCNNNNNFNNIDDDADDDAHDIIIIIITS